MPANVLIVEDEPAIVDFLRDNLREDEHSVTGSRHRARRRSWRCAATATTSCWSTSGCPTAPGSTSCAPSAVARPATPASA